MRLINIDELSLIIVSIVDINEHIGKHDSRKLDIEINMKIRDTLDTIAFHAKCTFYKVHPFMSRDVTMLQLYRNDM